MEGTFKNDERTGAWTEWYDNGTKEAEGTYKNGERTGAWTYWHENGKVASKGSYNDDGEQTGTWTYWDETGKVIQTSVYSNGELISVDGVAVDERACACEGVASEEASN